MAFKYVYRFEHKVDGYGPWNYGENKRAHPDLDEVTGRFHYNGKHPTGSADFNSRDDDKAWDGEHRFVMLNKKGVLHWFGDWIAHMDKYFNLVKYKVPAVIPGRLVFNGIIVQGLMHVPSVISRKEMTSEEMYKFLGLPYIK